MKLMEYGAVVLAISAILYHVPIIYNFHATVISLGGFITMFTGIIFMEDL